MQIKWQLPAYSVLSAAFLYDRDTGELKRWGAMTEAPKGLTRQFKGEKLSASHLAFKLATGIDAPRKLFSRDEDPQNLRLLNLRPWLSDESAANYWDRVSSREDLLPADGREVFLALARIPFIAASVAKVHLRHVRLDRDGQFVADVDGEREVFSGLKAAITWRREMLRDLRAA